MSLGLMLTTGVANATLNLSGSWTGRFDDPFAGPTVLTFMLTQTARALRNDRFR